MAMNLVFLKTMEDEDVNLIKKSFYAKEALAELLNSDIKNQAAIDAITEKYQNAYGEWSDAMNAIQDKYLEGNSFPEAKFNINFTTKKFELIFENLSDTMIKEYEKNMLGRFAFDSIEQRVG